MVYVIEIKAKRNSRREEGDSLGDYNAIVGDFIIKDNMIVENNYVKK